MINSLLHSLNKLWEHMKFQITKRIREIISKHHKVNIFDSIKYLTIILISLRKRRITKS